MSWELHLTVVGAAHALDAFAACTGAARLRLEVEGDDAAHVEEMMTLRLPPDADAAMTAATLSARAVDLGIAIVRTKVEAPIDDATPALYLEHHVRVRLPRPSLPELSVLAARHHAHLSRRARSRELGDEERYLTVRFEAHETAREAAALEELVRALARASFAITKVERERVVLDRRAAAS